LLEISTMLRALAIKELRETSLIALAGLAALMVCAAAVMGIKPVLLPGFKSLGIPFVSDGFAGLFAIVAICLAIALGLRQSFWESLRGTSVFLLHRPLSWPQLIGVKLAIGLTLYLATAALPVLLLAWWAATPGNHASPFEWSMTYPTWKTWLSVTALYFAAFLCGVRPARWLWSRLWPLVGVGYLVVLIQLLPAWPLLGLGAVLLIDAALLAAILFVIRNRDY
jgi:hypothetical protein